MVYGLPVEYQELVGKLLYEIEARSGKLTLEALKAQIGIRHERLKWDPTAQDSIISPEQGISPNLDVGLDSFPTSQRGDFSCENCGDRGHTKTKFWKLEENRGLRPEWYKQCHFLKSGDMWIKHTSPRCKSWIGNFKL